MAETELGDASLTVASDVGGFELGSLITGPETLGVEGEQSLVALKVLLAVFVGLVDGGAYFLHLPFEAVHLQVGRKPLSTRPVPSHPLKGGSTPN